MDGSQTAPQTVETQRVFQGRVFNLRRDQVCLDDGQLVDLDIIEHRGSAAILALDPAGALLLVRQYRQAAGRFLWELPAGVIEAGEGILEGALRELAEETGYRAGRTRDLGGCFPTPGYSDEILHFVLAEELSPGQRHLDNDERIDVRAFSLAELADMAFEGEIADAKTLLAIAWLQGDRRQLLGASSDKLGIGDTAAS